MGNLITSKGTAEPQRRRIMIVDDHPIVRLGLAQLINREPDLEVCGEAEGVVEALRKMDESRPDVVIIDISLDGEDGIELIEHAKARWAELKILVSSAHDERTFAGRVLRRRHGLYPQGRAHVQDHRGHPKGAPRRGLPQSGDDDRLLTAGSSGQDARRRSRGGADRPRSCRCSK